MSREVCKHGVEINMKCKECEGMNIDKEIERIFKKSMKETKIGVFIDNDLLKEKIKALVEEAVEELKECNKNANDKLAEFYCKECSGKGWFWNPRRKKQDCHACKSTGYIQLEEYKAKVDLRVIIEMFKEDLESECQSDTPDGIDTEGLGESIRILELSQGGK